MPKILIPVDGSENALRAVQHACSIVKENGAIELHLLNVQEPIDDGRVSAYLSHEKINELAIAAGERMLQRAKAVFDNADIRYVENIRVGHIAKTIVDYAQDEGCDSIIMGTRGLSPLGTFMMGSITNKVIHLVHVPVTLVK